MRTPIAFLASLSFILTGSKMPLLPLKGRSLFSPDYTNALCNLGSALYRLKVFRAERAYRGAAVGENYASPKLTYTMAASTA